MTTADVNSYISNKYDPSDIQQVFVFEQAWGSTALGFGCVGGSVMTSAWTHVIFTWDGKYYVFFNGKYAYTVYLSNEKFMEDLMKQNMQSVDGARRYYNK